MPEKLSLAPLAKALEGLTNKPVTFLKDTVGPATEAAAPTLLRELSSPLRTPASMLTRRTRVSSPMARSSRPGVDVWVLRFSCPSTSSLLPSSETMFGEHVPFRHSLGVYFFSAIVFVYLIVVVHTRLWKAVQMPPPAKKAKVDSFVDKETPGKWQILLAGAWSDYDPDHSAIIEKAFIGDDATAQIIKASSRHKYVINFYNMNQTNISLSTAPKQLCRRVPANTDVTANPSAASSKPPANQPPPKARAPAQSGDTELPRFVPLRSLSPSGGASKSPL